MNERFEHATVGDIVAADFRTAAVFESFGIDFCCGGRRSLEDACRSAVANPEAVIRALEALPQTTTADDDVTRWPVDRLIDHILAVHHAYVRTALPTIARYLVKLHEVHGVRHPELARIAAIFDGVSGEFEQHMFKEEQILFPYVRDLGKRATQACGSAMSPFGTVENPIRMMEREHREAADELRLIRELTNGYRPPADGCATYQVCMAELDRFERDLHRHVHLENNVLFPKAVQLEKASVGA
jgi:regulator of cell morphogenesis and NO signaling